MLHIYIQYIKVKLDFEKGGFVKKNHICVDQTTGAISICL